MKAILRYGYFCGTLAMTTLPTGMEYQAIDAADLQMPELSQKVVLQKIDEVEKAIRAAEAEGKATEHLYARLARLDERLNELIKQQTFLCMCVFSVVWLLHSDFPLIIHRFVVLQ